MWKIIKNGFLAKIAWHYLCQEGENKNAHFRCNYLFWPNFFWTKTVQSRKNYKNRGFSGNCPKPKMTPFLWKRCFLTWLKKRVLLTVFLKSCVFLKTLFYSVFSKTQFFRNKNCMLKKTENLWKIVGWFLNMAKWYFLGVCFFEVLILKGLFLVCLALFQKWLKMLVFPNFFEVFSGVAHCCLSGFGRFRCFCVLLCLFFFFVLLLFSVLFALFLVLWLDVVVFVLFVLFVVFCFCLFLFVFF